jgi:anaerobic ribonucleoside-triphosphate reductase
MKSRKVRKTDERQEVFDRNKIVNSIYKAADFIGGKDMKRAEEVADAVVQKIDMEVNADALITTEQIYKIVVGTLIEMGHGKTAKSYELFRDMSKNLRNIKSLIDADELIRSYIDSNDWRVKENANMAYSWQGLNNHISTSVQSNYWLHSLYPKHVSDAHINADFHIHDLGMLAVYCLGWSLQDLLLLGFTGVPGKISCAPPKHLRSALGQSVNFLYTLQHEAAGAQAFSSFDTLLAPFIRYDKLDYKGVKQAIQDFVFNMNVPTRVGCQTPFTNITLDLVPVGELANEHVIIGGKYMPEQYKDFQVEMDMLNRAFAEVMTEGDASGRVFSFPIPTYNITKDFNWEDKNLDAIWEMTAKYGIPYFANFVNSDMSPDDARSMCCRLRIDNRELRKRGGGLFGSNPLTGSVGVVTLNMPRIGYLAKDKEDFFKRVADLMDIAKESLQIKRQWIEKYMDMGLYPYSRFYLKGIKERFGSYWKNHFNTIGLCGMNEACLNFLGKDLITEEGRDFTIEVLDFMRDRLMDYQNQTNEIFNLEASPAEGAAYRFAKSDRKRYPEIVVANDPRYVNHEIVKEKVEGLLNDEPFYTNSSQLPVDSIDDLFEALDVQDELQTKYTGGTVLHLFLGEKMPSIESTKNLVKKISSKYKLPYFSITPTFSICPKHGYLPGEHEYCPKCDVEIGYVEGDGVTQVLEIAEVAVK